MKMKLVGRLMVFDGKAWVEQPAEFLVDSEVDLEQEAWDRKRAREDERTKRGEDLAREFMRLESATFLTCSAPTRAAIMHILDTELPQL